MRVGESQCLRLELGEKEPMSGARMLLHCSNTTAQVDTILESSTSVPLTLESYVSLLAKILPPTYQHHFEIIPTFWSVIGGFIEVINGFHLTTAND